MMFSVKDCPTAVAQSLKENGIDFVEYGEMLEQRFGCPVALIVRFMPFSLHILSRNSCTVDFWLFVLQTVEWGILDDQIPRASEIILQYDLPLDEPSPAHASMHGKWETTGVIHKMPKTRIYTI